MRHKINGLIARAATVCSFFASAPLHAQNRGDSIGVARAVIDHISGQYSLAGLTAPQKFVFPTAHHSLVANPTGEARASGWSNFRTHVSERVKAGESTPPCSGPDASIAISAKPPVWE